jgi:hypothetical protein
VSINFTELAITDLLNADTLNDAMDELDAAVGAISGNVDLSLIAGEALPIRAAVRIGADGLAYLTSGDPAEWVSGVAVAAALLGAACSVRIMGVMDGFSGLTAGAVYYAGAAGGVSTTTDGNDRVAGIALSSTRLLIHPRNYQQRGVNDLAGRATGRLAPLTYGGGSIVL